MAEDGDPFKEETDVKPEVLPPTAEEDQQEDVKVAVDSLLSGSAPSSEGAAAEGERPESSDVFYHHHLSLTVGCIVSSSQDTRYRSFYVSL